MKWLKCLCIFNPKKKYVWNKAWLKNYSLKNLGINENVWVKIITSKMSYSESGSESNFTINSVSNFDPTFSESKFESNSESESDFS